MTHRILASALILVSQVVIGQTHPSGAYAQSAKGKQFHADYEEVITQTDVKGVEHKSVRHGVIARDAEGRTLRVTEIEYPTGTAKISQINDPVGKLSIKWTMRSNIATVTHYPVPTEFQRESGNFVKTLPTPSWCNVIDDVEKKTVFPQRKLNGLVEDGCQLELLNPKTKHPYYVENWDVIDLNLPVFCSLNDPDKKYKSHWIVTNITTDAPPETLFQPPADYEIENVDSPAATR